MNEAGVIPFQMPLAGQAGSSSRNVISLGASDELRFLNLTQRAASGDESAAREFFEAYCDRVFRYALVLARGNEEIAREVLSATMIKGLRHLRPMKTDEDVWRWLTRIARTTFIDHFRKTKRLISTAPEPALETAAQNPDQTLSAALNECLEELPLEERQIVERFYFDEESQTTLAQETHTTRKAVESRLARIRQKLRAAILRKLA
jgi:RNA polymerase sigma factor (sigma-70 family)